MNSQNITLILFIFLNFFSISFAEETGFDEVCKIYTEAKNSNMSIEVASKYIFDNIKKRVSSSDALKTHEAILSALGKERYALFKNSAEHTLKRSWECQSMKILMEM